MSYVIVKCKRNGLGTLSTPVSKTAYSSEEDALKAKDALNADRGIKSEEWYEVEVVEA